MAAGALSWLLVHCYGCWCTVMAADALSWLLMSCYMLYVCLVDSAGILIDVIPCLNGTESLDYVKRIRRLHRNGSD